MKRKGIRNTIVRRWVMSPAATAYRRFRQPGLFDDIGQFVLFIGHGRSGSSLVGALLNAHPNVVMSNELNVFEFLRENTKAEQLYNLVYDTARRQAEKGSKGGGGYTYAVPGQWQGGHEAIRVIGDRKAGATAIQLHNNPKLLTKLTDILPVGLRFISVVRNPYDTLTTTLKKTIRFPGEPEVEHLRRQIDHYFERSGAIRDVFSQFGEDRITVVFHDQLVANPQQSLAALCEFLKIPADDAYLAACASIIKPRANVTRFDVEWPDELIQVVADRMQDYPWLRHYRFAAGS